MMTPGDALNPSIPTPYRSPQGGEDYGEVHG